MVTTKRILIIGGGYGGVWAGKILGKHFRNRDDIEITLVDKRPFHTLMTELHEVAGWRTDPDSVRVSFRKIFGARQVKAVVDLIERVDFVGGKAFSAQNQYPFDYIVIGSGAEPEFFGIPGVQKNSFALWSFDDALRLRNHLEQAFERAAAEPDRDKRRRLLTFVVAGAGFTGIEMIGELLEYRDAMCKRLFLDPAESRVVLIEALPSILPILEAPLRDQAEAYLTKKGCEIHLGQAIVSAGSGVVSLKDGSAVETETFIWTCGVKGSSFAGSLGLPTGKRNRLLVDEEMRSPAYPFVYIVGDNAWFSHDNQTLPQVVETAHFTAETAAKNIIADIEGGERHTLRGNYHGFMVSLGGRYCVSNAGGMKTSGFIAMAMKHVINLYYLFGIAGANQVWEYIKHEFLDMKSGRSILGGFVAHKVRTHWIVLLRLWLGFMWIVEGANKIAEGWLDFSKGQSKSGWMFSKGVLQAGVKSGPAAWVAPAAAVAAPAAVSAATSVAPAAAAAAPAAVSAATSVAPAAAAPAAVSAASSVAPAAAAAAPAAVSAATSVAPAAVAAAAAPAAVSGTVAAHATVKSFLDTTMPIISPNSGLATWFRHTFMDGIFAYLPFSVLQSMIVFTEIGIGLAIFGGLFTWWAAAISIIMCFLFTFTGMFTWSQAWFIFAAIVMLGGAGRGFGLDYWLVPFFKKRWNTTKLARRSHLYADDPTR
jgi:NADH dehydrogenase